MTKGNGEDARDEGMERAMQYNQVWRLKAVTLIRNELYDWQGTGEDLHEWLRRHGLKEPTTPHAWGPLDAFLTKWGHIERVPGGYDKMKKESSHARETRVYRRD